MLLSRARPVTGMVASDAADLERQRGVAELGPSIGGGRAEDEARHNAIPISVIETNSEGRVDESGIGLLEDGREHFPHVADPACAVIASALGAAPALHAPVDGAKVSRLMYP